jgi:hypothetical protein
MLYAGRCHLLLLLLHPAETSAQTRSKCSPNALGRQVSPAAAAAAAPG